LSYGAAQVVIASKSCAAQEAKVSPLVEA